MGHAHRRGVVNAVANARRRLRSLNALLTYARLWHCACGPLYTEVSLEKIVLCSPVHVGVRLVSTEVNASYPWS